MKKLFLTLIVVVACFSSAFAQGYLGVNPNNYESNWPDFDYHDYLSQEPFVAAIAIDGQVVTLENANWSDLEVAAFVTTAEGQEECRSNLMWLTDEYVIEYGDPYLTIDGFPIYYNTVGGTVYFKMHDHANNIDYTECTITYLDEPYTVTAGLEVVYGWGDGEPPVILNFTTPSAVDCEKIVLNEGNGYEWFRDFEAEGEGHTTDPYTGVLLDCWTVAHEYASASMNHIGAEVDTLPQLYYNSNFANSGDYSLRMKYRVLYAMPELDTTVDMSRLKLSMYVRQTHSYYKLQVGVMSDLEDESTFVPVALVDNGEITTPQYFECRFTNYDGEGRYIVFKNLAGSKKDPYSTNYLDDVKLTYVEEESCVKPLAYEENFDDYTLSTGTMGVEPDCWEVITPESELSPSTCPQLYDNPSFAHSGDYSLRLRNRCVYAMPELELPEGKSISDLTMTFWLRQPRTIYHLQVGVVNADGEFELVKEIANPNAEVTEVSVDFSTYTGEDGVRIAFRNTLGYCPNYYYSINYIDDINVDLTENMRAVADGNGNGSMSADSYLDGIGVYPNPTTGNLYIDAMDVQKVECFNQMGQLVGVYDNANELNISDLSNGVYMLRITVPQGVTMRKVVKR